MTEAAFLVVLCLAAAYGLLLLWRCWRLTKEIWR